MKPKLQGKALDSEVLRAVALGMADGQLEQADRYLLIAAGLERRRPRENRDPLVLALEHMRSACRWLQAIA